MAWKRYGDFDVIDEHILVFRRKGVSVANALAAEADVDLPEPASRAAAEKAKAIFASMAQDAGFADGDADGAACVAQITGAESGLASSADSASAVAYCLVPRDESWIDDLLEAVQTPNLARRLASCDARDAEDAIAREASEMLVLF